jgi:TonB family protein
MNTLRSGKLRLASSLIVLSVLATAQDPASFIELMKKHFFPAPAGVTRVIISQGVLKPKKYVQPVTPGHASRLSSTVRLAVLIAEDGKVEQIHLIEGHPILVNAAIDAVRQWEYEPRKSDGKPVQMATEVRIKFSANQP